MLRGTIAVLVSSTLALAALTAPACVVPTISQNSTDAGAAAPAASAADGGTTAATTAPAAATGTSCTQINATTSLCQTISTCPGLTLNAQVFPQCGFRIHGTAIDPECYCQNEYLCPIGSPTTCAEAATESTGDVNYDSVCEESVQQGRCTDLGAGATTSAACASCVQACDNVPACVEACGC
jgi:hypothetical protein